MIRRLKKAIRKWESPVVARIGGRNKPFHVLITCILSIRTRDEATEAASARLFALADTPQKMLSLSPVALEKAIYPAAFFRVKTKTILQICRTLIDEYNGKVPDTIDELLKLKGVGRKTANLTVISGYGKFGICVDTHVHRIFNRWGYVATRSPDETEKILRKKLPKKYWKEINTILVTFGQNLCKPISPLCSACDIAELCQRVGVRKSR